MPIIADHDLRSYLSINGNQHATNVSFAVAAANQAVVLWCGRDFEKVEDVSTRLFSPGDGDVAVIDDFWTATGFIVETDDDDDGTYGTTWDTADLQLEPLNQRIDGVTWPYYRIVNIGTSGTFPTCRTRPSIRVTAAWGWPAVPDAVFQATLLKAARLFHRKDSPQGVAGFGEFGAVRLANSEDPDVVSLLAPFRRVENFVMVG